MYFAVSLFQTQVDTQQRHHRCTLVEIYRQVTLGQASRNAN